MQNRRNVQVGSRDNQQKPRPGKDGFLLHTRLGLVGWIAYWSYGDAALAVVILVALINTLGLTELVSDALGNRKQKEAETNAKILDLLKNALDETKNCRNEQQRVEYSPWKTTMTSGQDVSEYLDTFGLVKSYFFKFFERMKLKKN